MYVIIISTICKKRLPDDLGKKRLDLSIGTHENNIKRPIIPRIHDKLHILQVAQTIPILLARTGPGKGRAPAQGPRPEPGNLLQARTQVFLGGEVGDDF